MKKHKLKTMIIYSFSQGHSGMELRSDPNQNVMIVFLRFQEFLSLNK